MPAHNARMRFKQEEAAQRHQIEVQPGSGVLNEFCKYCIEQKFNIIRTLIEYYGHYLTWWNYVSYVQ